MSKFEEAKMSVHSFNGSPGRILLFVLSNGTGIRLGCWDADSAGLDGELASREDGMGYTALNLSFDDAKQLAMHLMRMVRDEKLSGDQDDS
jgi:hypothetical protein